MPLHEGGSAAAIGKTTLWPLERLTDAGGTSRSTRKWTKNFQAGDLLEIAGFYFAVVKRAGDESACGSGIAQRKKIVPAPHAARREDLPSVGARDDGFDHEQDPVPRSCPRAQAS